VLSSEDGAEDSSETATRGQLEAPNAVLGIRPTD